MTPWPNRSDFKHGTRNGTSAGMADRTKQGNPLLRVSEDADHWTLQISRDRVKSGHTGSQAPRYAKLTIPLYICRKVSKQTGQRSGRDY